MSLKKKKASLFSVAAVAILYLPLSPSACPFKWPPYFSRKPISALFLLSFLNSSGKHHLCAPCSHGFLSFLFPAHCNLASFSQRQQKCFFRGLWGLGMSPDHVFLCILICVVAFWHCMEGHHLLQITLPRGRHEPWSLREGRMWLCSFARNCEPEA